jgi:hypothetical protein
VTAGDVFIEPMTDATRSLPFANGIGRFLHVLGWDGALPLLVASVPALLKSVLPKGHIALVTAAILVPILAALVRASDQ